MSATGYSTLRAEAHDVFFDEVAAELQRRGYSPQGVPCDGHRPDGVLRGLAAHPYFDTKTGKPNITIEVESLFEYESISVIESRRVYVIHGQPGQPPSVWTVDTPQSLTARIRGGPRRRSGSGSNDDWYLVLAGGTPFEDFFPTMAA